ncbi:hypothetical protein N431DRAFT_183374 [Stipitochalara longipes BDJ]|nr:hypothetical protein N431DRAFT_183374 [Stipitochalara longipes BDJ]
MDKFRYPKSLSASSTPKHTANPCPVAIAPPTPIATLAKAKVTFTDPTLEENEDSLTPKITNLCSTIAGCFADLPKYGCLRGESRQYLVEPLCCANKEPQKYVTLETLLSKSSPIKLSRRQRFRIALTLASSHVQLHSTPWLKSKWSKREVLFLYDPHDQMKIATDQPYISRSVSKSSQQSIENTATPESSGAEGKDEKWREDMFAKVVEPLKYCHDQIVTI